MLNCINRSWISFRKLRGVTLAGSDPVNLETVL